MGKVDYFVVEFYAGKRTFYPGEAINAALCLKVNKKLKLQGLRIEFHGEAYVHWRENVGEANKSYSNSETYLDTLATLFGKDLGQSGDDPVLQPGEYSFPFQFLIPNIIMPASVELKHGHVRYWLKGIMDRPWRFDIITIAAVTILKYVDINIPQLLRPCQKEEDRNVGFLCCVSGSLSTTFCTDRGGYCPGESIRVSTVIDNKSKNEVVGLKIQLLRIIVLIASCGTATHWEDKVASISKEGVKPGDTLVSQLQLPVPSVPQTMQSCSCLKISYLLRLKVRVKGASDSKLYIPIIIGTLPYRPYFPAQYLPSDAVLSTNTPPLTRLNGTSVYLPATSQKGDKAPNSPNADKSTASFKVVAKTAKNRAKEPSEEPAQKRAKGPSKVIYRT
ncbi:unnamed protein product [Porites evermanni]|uniref:Arrestin C-terminal-like domain-containing protein n=1 Tax=Porites evermanni TaxID=104178 RepID=A0ABN8MAU9_9CNID|nr:unnamed protein product [Porites evermanni]